MQFLYLKEAFSPSLDERISVLFEAFGNDGKLVVNYALIPAWG
jgi:ubiquitin-like protein ATG12